jgi:hypothetical protein
VKEFPARGRQEGVDPVAEQVVELGNRRHREVATPRR